MGEKVHTSISSNLDRNKIITELFNSYFAKQHILPSNAKDKSLPPFHYITEHRCPHLHIYPADVLMVINSLNVNKSVGPDGISNKMLQLAGLYISQSLAKLSNNSLNTSSFPAAWKQANITPGHKKGDRQTIINYRPISLLSNI